MLPMLASVSGLPRAGPALRRGASSGATFSKAELCAQDEGFNLHAATRAGAADAQGREALLRYILRPPVAQERIVPGPDGLVSPVGDHEARRIALKRPFSDGTVAIDMDPVSLLLRLCAAVPAPRFHTTRYCGVIASASKWRPKIVPQTATDPSAVSELALSEAAEPTQKKGWRYWGWAELMARTFQVDVTLCPKCGGRLKLVALVQEPENVARLLRGLGEPTDTPARAPPRPPRYYRSAVMRRLTGTHLAVA